MALAIVQVSNSRIASSWAGRVSRASCWSTGELGIGARPIISNRLARLKYPLPGILLLLRHEIKAHSAQRLGGCELGGMPPSATRRGTAENTLSKVFLSSRHSK